MIAGDPGPERIPSVRVIAMPADTNPAGDVFGGWLMCQMDLAAGNLAGLTCRGRAATVAVDSIVFLQPVRVGDEVSVYTELLSTGRSSMRIAVEAWRRPRDEYCRFKVTEAAFTFVAIDELRRPRPIPGPETAG